MREDETDMYKSCESHNLTIVGSTPTPATFL